ncbi:MAG: tyrosine-protein phosphatase [Kiritimatiellae bacterium]|nr:tyrosine-protein phosphatase [Kiritimatiellia bacterium]
MAMNQVAAFLFAAVSAVASDTRPLAKRPVSEFVEKARAAYAAEAHCPCTNSVWTASMHAPGAFNDRPVPVRIEWARSGDVGATYTLSLRAKTASEPVRVIAGLKDTLFDAENLLAGTDYEWFAQSVSASGGCTDVGHGEFSTEAGVVRWLSVPGARNVRDIGGWTGLRQGRVYRGSQLNGLPRHPVGLSAEGRKVLVRDLRVRTEVDFRAPNREERGDFVSESAAGLRLLSRPVPPPPALFDPKAASAYRAALMVFADDGNYPVYMHCAAGAERTGMVAFMLEGLCGAPEEVLCADFELTGFSCFDERPRSLPRFRACIEKIRARPGATLHEKFADFAVKGLGLSEGDVAAIRRNLAGGTGRGGVRVVRDVPYDPSIGKVGSGDLYLPDGEEMGLVLLIHGGGWAYGDRRMCDGIADFFVRELGMAVYNIDYRLASARHPFPACADDCVNAAWVALSPEFRAKHGLAAHSLWVCGGSAGGHLALWVGVRVGVPGVAGVLDISGIGDAAIDRAANPGRYPVLFGGTATDGQVASMSITSMKLPRCGPPVLCTHAVDDTVVPIASAEAFATAYRAAGSRCEFFRYRATEEMSRLTGHMIWIPGSWPHKLIPSLERELARFIDRVEGVRR